METPNFPENMEFGNNETAVSVPVNAKEWDHTTRRAANNRIASILLFSFFSISESIISFR